MAEAPKVLLGVSGSAAAFKAAELLRLMQKRGWDVWVVMTACATQYVGPLTFRALSGHPVPHGAFADADPDTYTHLGLSEGARGMIVAPCTAQTLARLANGMADDILSCTALSLEPGAPLLVAPAMNTRMWKNPATRENADRLRARGVHFAGPVDGALACGASGPGRLAEPADILAAFAAAAGLN